MSERVTDSYTQTNTTDEEHNSSRMAQERRKVSKTTLASIRILMLRKL